MCYNFKAKERFEKKLQQVSIPTWAKETTPEFKEAYSKYRAVEDRDNQRYIFDDEEHGGTICHYLSFNRVEIDKKDSLYSDQELMEDLVVQMKASVAEILPPRFKVCKNLIIGAGVAWPITLIWLMLSRVIKQLIERIISLFGSTFDSISKATFGKI